LEGCTIVHGRHKKHAIQSSTDAYDLLPARLVRSFGFGNIHVAIVLNVGWSLQIRNWTRSLRLGYMGNPKYESLYSSCSSLGGVSMKRAHLHLCELIGPVLQKRRHKEPSVVTFACRCDARRHRGEADDAPLTRKNHAVERNIWPWYDAHHVRRI
jgi:hypothetical protein